MFDARQACCRTAKIHAAVTNVSQIVALITDDERRNHYSWLIVRHVHPPWIEAQQSPAIEFAA
jgi:hypothetical protein